MLEVRSRISATALRRLGSFKTGSSVLNSSSRGHGSAQAYGRPSFQATAFLFFARMAWNADRGIFMALSSWWLDISRALFCGEPASTQIRRLGSGRAWKPVLAPHQFGSRSQTNCVALKLPALYEIGRAHV